MNSNRLVLGLHLLLQPLLELAQGSKRRIGVDGAGRFLRRSTRRELLFTVLAGGPRVAAAVVVPLMATVMALMGLRSTVLPRRVGAWALLRTIAFDRCTGNMVRRGSIGAFMVRGEVGPMMARPVLMRAAAGLRVLSISARGPIFLLLICCWLR